RKHHQQSTQRCSPPAERGNSEPLLISRLRCAIVANIECGQAGCLLRGLQPPSIFEHYRTSHQKLQDPTGRKSRRPERLYFPDPNGALTRKGVLPDPSNWLSRLQRSVCAEKRRAA